MGAQVIASWADLPCVGTPSSWACFSEDMKYRYALARRWDIGSCCLFFIMLNPSVADATKDDATIRRCIGFAKREGYGSILVRNVFAYRSTDPKKLLEVDDPVGPENQRILDFGATLASALPAWTRVAAWGNIPKKLIAKAPRIKGPLLCLGTTQDGNPRHPLRLRADTPLVPWPFEP